ncbi:hypothetical protein Pcac1_g5649 [Phytophthora cactorum]|nr:hypothetical protein Pcac1_g5649 [Phytophthora cactorum]
MKFTALAVTTLVAVAGVAFRQTTTSQLSELWPCRNLLHPTLSLLLLQPLLSNNTQPAAANAPANAAWQGAGQRQH